jgi:N-acetylneuraminic acid mutarotase
MNSSGGDFSASGTIGQHDAGMMSGGDFFVNGGFWGGIAGSVTSATPTYTPSDTPTATSTPTCPAVGTAWQFASPFPSIVSLAAADSDGNYAYSAGGSLSGGVNLDYFQRYNPTADTWTELAPMPVGAGGVSLVYAPITQRFYAFGGYLSGAPGLGLDVTRIYDPAAGIWSLGTAMPGPRYLMGAGYYNGKIYLVAGGDENGVYNQVWEYDPLLDTWDTIRAPMPGNLYGSGSGIIDGHLFVAGGLDEGYAAVDTLYDYDIANDTWTTRAPLPAALYEPGSAAIGGQLWVFGGEQPLVRGRIESPKAPDSPSDTSALTYIYDPASDSWGNGAALNVARSAIAGTSVGPYVLAIGGYSYPPATNYDTVEVFVAGCPSPTPEATSTNTPVPLTATPSETTTPTGTPGSALLVGHVTWQGRPAQPNALQQLPITLALKLGITEVNYPSQNTDAGGFFTVSVASMPNGTYNWRVKGPKYLANSGSVNLTGAAQTNIEMGLMRTGDCNNDNVISVLDFNILKATFGKGLGDPGYDGRADFTGDQLVSVTDFNLQKGNFGQGGAPPIMPLNP